MKNALLIFFVFFSVAAFGQYNPSAPYLTNLNKPIGLTSKPDGGRTYYYDAANFSYRPYVSIAEANSWLQGGARQGHFYVIINTGGTLSGGIILGGTNAAYWWKDGIADANLVPMPNGTVTGLSFPSAYGFFSSIANPASTPLINFALDTNHTSGLVTWPGLRAQGYGTGGSGTVTSVSGLTPLFSVTNSSTTPTFILSSAPGTYRLWGSNNSSVPSYLAFIDSNYAPMMHSQAYYNGYYKNILSGNADSIKGLPVDTSARRNAWVLSFDSTNHKFYLAAPGTGGGGGGLSSLNSQTGATQTFATGTSGSDFNINSAANVHTFNFPNASASNRGLLTSSDWSLFNGKQNAGNYITGLSGDGTASGPGGAALTLTSIITAGSCTNCALTYDAKGRITVASSTSPSSGWHVLTDASTVAIDMNNGTLQNVAIAATRNVAIANLYDGASLILAVKHNADGTILNLPGNLAWNFQWALFSGQTTVCSGVYNSTTGYWIWTSDIVDSLLATLSTPTMTTPTVLSSTSLGLSWGAISGATNYVLQQSLTGTGGWSTVYSGGTASYTATGLTTGTTYYYQVQAQGSGYANSAFSSVVNGTPIVSVTYLTIASPPADFHRINSNKGWQQTPNTTAYAQFDQTLSDGQEVVVKISNVTTNWNIIGLATNLTGGYSSWTYSMQLHNSNAASSYSSSVNLESGTPPNNIQIAFLYKIKYLSGNIIYSKSTNGGASWTDLLTVGSGSVTGTFHIGMANFLDLSELSEMYVEPAS